MISLPPLVRRILAERGIEGEEAIEEFLDPSLKRLVSPLALPGVRAAVPKILDAVTAGRHIVVFGDYDCDGICASAIMVRTLRALGADVSSFLPDRLSEGYGMSASSVERMLRDNPSVSLIITVDNGINSVDEIAGLSAKGVEVIVTDHHLPGEVLPGCTVVNPIVAAPEELRTLCGAGVAFFIASALMSLAKERGMYSGGCIGGPLLVLAGLATVTDIMPLMGQNRILVAEALARFRQCAPVGLRELYARSSRSTRMTSRDFGFLLGPRMNAPGRLASGTDSLELVLASDSASADRFAQIVDAHNVERKIIEQRMTEEALSKVIEGAEAQVIDLPDGHPGVAGIVAARVLEKVNVPVCVIVGAHGSARAPAGYNLRDAFVASADVLERFGGHAVAGGLSVKAGKVDVFRELFRRACSAQSAAVSKVDDEFTNAIGITAGEIDLELADALVKLEPFGEGNPEPVFRMDGVVLGDIRTLGIDGRHLQFMLDGLKCVWWGHGNMIEELRRSPSAPRSVCFTIEASDYGARHVELRARRID